MELGGATRLFRVSADNISLVLSNNQQMQDKTAQLTANSIKLGLRANVSKTKVMKVSSTNIRPVTMRDTILEEATSFVYLGSIGSNNGRLDYQPLFGKGARAPPTRESGGNRAYNNGVPDENIKVRINKARVC